jgi:hypothetical protein
MEYTPLIIKNNSGTATGSTKVWNKLNNVMIVIKSIPAAAVVKGKDTSNSTGKIISGIPTPWARATIFKYALQVDDGVSPGLKDFYQKIKVEWRSLIAFVALYSEDIKIEKIELDGDISNPSNFKARLGGMLFEEKVLWDDPTSNLDENPPYIQLIKYKVDTNKYVTIGATSPYTVVFTPPKVRAANNENLPKFFKRGEWVEPTKCDLNDKELQKIYDTVTYMREQLGYFNDLINKKVKTGDLKLNSASLDTVLKKYQQDLKKHPNGRNIKDFNIFNAPKKFFQAPFDILFNAEAKLYRDGGKFYRNRRGRNIAFKVEDFLAPSNKGVEIVFKPNTGENPIKNTAHLLEIKIKGKGGKPENRYFAIPLSYIGIKFFQNSLDLLLDENSNSKHQLRGEIEDSPSGKRLKISLTIEFYTGNPLNTNQKDTTTVEKSYELPTNVKLHEEKIIVWPNFIANDWKKYYLYSDLPHNLKDNEVKAFPLLGKVNKDKSIELKQNFDELSYIELKDSEKEDTNIQGVKIAVRNLENSTNRTLNYEIYESELPFLGVELRVGTDEEEKAGYLITKNFTKIVAPEELKLEFKGQTILREAIVGIDFGSNNTSISYYSRADTSQKLVTLHNRRRFFMGSERFEDNNLVANAMELFFFNKTKAIGQLKSMLVAHDKTKLADPVGSNKVEIRGGFPIIEKNLPISINRMDQTDSKYKLDIKSSEVNVIHNMKWSPDPDMNNYKFSFLKTLWLQINAELYTIQHKPTILRWAYPAAMGDSLRNNYRIMWGDVAKIQPLTTNSNVTVEALTEGTAVATYAIKNPTLASAPGGRLAVGIGNMGIGYDIGGSTTDILILIKKPENTSAVLAKQSSILLAAQYLSKAIKRSPRIQEVLTNFLAEERIDIHGIEKMNNDTAPYFLNAVFDRLTAKQLQSLYGYLFLNDEKRLFAIVSYVSGLILYYTGQLAARVILEEKVDINFISKGIYGKGGNIFNWITTVMPQASRAYYQECFFTGLGKTEALDEKIENLKKKSDSLASTKTSTKTSTKDLDALKKELEVLEGAYKVFPNDEIKVRIDDLKTQLTIIAEDSEQQGNVDIPNLNIKKSGIENELSTLKQTIKWVSLPAIDKRIKELEEDLKRINVLLDELSSSGNNEEELEGLERIKKVIINRNAKYETNFKENKNEVSYGLSSDTQIEKLNGNNVIPEIVGEEGYTYNGKPFKFTDVIESEHLKSFGGKFKYPDRFEKLEEFTEIYCDFVAKNGLLNTDNIREAVKELSRTEFLGYVQGLPQFSSARAGAIFDFKSPMIILEGMCLLDRVILEELL